MASKVNIQNITNLTGNETSAVNRINTNFDRLAEAVDDSLSRSGQDPNAMEFDLDMNSNDILNAGTIYANAIVVEEGSITTVTGDLVELTSIAALRGYNTPDIPDASVVAVKAYYSGGQVGGGHFMYRSNNTDDDDGGFNIVDALGRVWRRQNTYKVFPEMFGAKGNGVWDDTEYFNDALDYCARNGIDFDTLPSNYTFSSYMESYPRTNKFTIYLNGTYTWPEGTTYGGIFIEPIAGGLRPDIIANAVFYTGDDNLHTCLLYDNWKNISDTNIDKASYGMTSTDGSIQHISGMTMDGLTGVTTSGWKNGIVTNCCNGLRIDNIRSGGRKGGGTADQEVSGIDTSITGLSNRGIACFYRDYITRTITDISVDPSDGVVTVTWSTGTAWNPRSGYVFFDNLDGDLGKALNWRTFRVANIDSGSNTFELAKFDGRDLPEYTSGGTFEGAPSAATVEIAHTKLQWYDVMMHVAGYEGMYFEDNRHIGGAIGLMAEEQLSLEFVGMNHFNCTVRPVYARGIGGVWGDSPVLIFGRRNGCIMDGITMTSVGVTTTGSWTAGTTLPWQFSDGKWVTFSTASEEKNVLDITIGANPTLTYSGDDVYTNGDTVIITNLPGDWAALEDADGKVTATVGSLNTAANTFVLLGFDSSSMTTSYVDNLVIEDPEEGLEYATVSGGMFEITEDYYEITDIDRTARTFRIVHPITGDDIDSSAWNSWSDGRMFRVVEPAVFENCMGINISGWKFNGQKPVLTRGIIIKNCKVDIGSNIENITAKAGTYAVIELEGTTNYINIGEQRPNQRAADKIVWDRTDKTANFYRDRRQLTTQNFTTATHSLNALGSTEVAHPPVSSVRYNLEGTVVLNNSQNVGLFKTDGIMNVTDPTSDEAGLVILSAADLGPVENNVFLFHDRMPRFIMPGAHLDLHYDSTDLFWRSLSTDKFEDVFQHWTDFYSTTGTETGASGTNAAVTASSFQVGSNPRRPMGMVQLATGTTNTGSAHVGPLTYGWRLNTGAMLGICRVAIETLATDGIEDYVVRIGFHNHYAGSSLTRGVYWQYDVGDNVKWTANAMDGSGSTQVVSTKTVAVNDYNYFGVFVNGDATRADFFWWEEPSTITLLDSITTNIPTNTNLVGFGANITKTAGTTSRNIHVDSLGFSVMNRRGAT